MNDHKKVLLVDDEPELAHGAGLWLKHAGFDTDTALDGYEAIEKAEQQRPDLIVMDIRMPRLDGLSALKILREGVETSRIPIVILSASVTDQATALDAGASFFLRMPFDGKELIAAALVATAASWPLRPSAGQRSFSG